MIECFPEFRTPHNSGHIHQTFGASTKGLLQRQQLVGRTPVCVLSKFLFSACSHLDTVLPVVESARCLGVWWCSNSTSRKSVEEHVCKARKAFFANGDLGAFHGLLNPLSSRNLVESCVLPVLMYGAEAWCINASLLLKLESFQSEIGKKILKLPKFSANQVPLLALNWPTMRCRCLCAKLSFLYKIHSSERSTLSTEVFNSLTFPSIESTLLINQCHLLE